MKGSDEVPGADMIFSDGARFAVRPTSDPAVARHSYGEIELGTLQLTALPVVAIKQPPEEKFHLKSALWQSFEFLMLEHAFRIADDPSLRYSLAHAPFVHNWFASYKGYDLERWGDGDDFIVNDIGHPLQGAVASRIYLQNGPSGGDRQIAADRKYWTSRLKGMAWSAAFEVQWKIGPLSETSLGNAGGWLYVPGCGSQLWCLNNPKYPKPPTNNTGLTDWIITPVVGTGWVVLEDTLDKYIATKVAVHHRILGGMILRTALEPSRSFAGLFMGKLPWQSRAPEAHPAKLNQALHMTTEEESSWQKNRRSFGIHYVRVSLPIVGPNLRGREADGGVGFVYGYRAFRNAFFDSELNYFPGGGSSGRPTLEGLFGTKVGHQGKNWGVFGKVRPGFIYYEHAWTGGESPKFDSLSRLTLDTGGTVEVYPSPKSTLRFDVGTTLVRYLQDYPNPRLSRLGSLQSPDFYVNQGNFQISSGYAIRF